ATASKINCEYVSMRCDLRSRPWRLGTMPPASLRQPRHRIALAALTPKCSAAQVTINRGDHPLGQRKATWPYMLTSLASMQLDSHSGRTTPYRTDRCPA